MSLCGGDYCAKCSIFETCKGCANYDGHPFCGKGNCIAAETIKIFGKEYYEELKKSFVEEINDLNIPGLIVNDLNLLNGFYVNLEYEINGHKIKLLKDEDVYLGNQIERKDTNRCYGVIVSRQFVIVCDYGEGGSDPKLLYFKTK